MLSAEIVTFSAPISCIFFVNITDIPSKKFAHCTGPWQINTVGDCGLSDIIMSSGMKAMYV